MNKGWKQVAIAAAVLSMSIAPAVVADSPAEGLQTTITVSASASSYTTPDKARLTVRVEKSDPEAAEATVKLTETADAVLEAIKGAGVDAEDIATSGYRLSPDYHYDDDGKYILDGYTAVISYTVKDLTIDSVGALITAATDAGATEIEDIAYECSDYDARYGEALAEAVKLSRQKADALAKASGTQIIGVDSISEGYQDDSARYKGVNYAYTESAAMDSAVMSDAVQIEPGETEIEASVTVVYSMQGKEAAE